jgi:hypothetical protein
MRPGARIVDERTIADVLQLPFAAVVHELIEMLGPTSTAILGDVTETTDVRAWEAGAAPHGAIEPRLRAALQATRLLSMSDGPLVAKAWWFGMNPRFDGVAPAEVLRRAAARDTATFVQIVGAARAAATG